MKIIGAGLPRTATTTQMCALEQLNQWPCYHMRDLLADLETGLPLWERAAEGDGDWEQIFAGVSSTVDWPAARFYAEIADYFPDAKVLLSVRPHDAWVRSMRRTVWGMYHGDSVMHHLCEARGALDPLWGRFLALMRWMTWEEGTGGLAGETHSDAGLAAAMDRWNDRVRATIAPERLLVWDPSEGWEPVCEFLGEEPPSEPLPRLNDTDAFREGIIGGAVDTITEWWDARERPDSGLHGAPAANPAAV